VSATQSVPAEILAKTPTNAQKGLQALYERGYVSRKLANVDPRDIITRYLSDEKTKDIAASYGVDRSALNYFLLRACEADWKDAQSARAITQLEQAKEELEAAADAFTLARARERLRSAQWDLERLLSRLFGQKQEVSHTVAPVLHIHLAQDVGAVIEHQPLDENK
jgi:hypothetical protein